MWITIRKDADIEGLPIFQKKFTLNGDLVRCKLKITATGIFSVKINGHVIPDLFMPGWSNYVKYIDVCEYDITEYIVKENTISVTVANGWYSGKLGYGNRTNVFGDTKRLFAEIELEYKDGKNEKIVTDDSWDTYVSDIVFADFFGGETIDARRRLNNEKTVYKSIISQFDISFATYDREPVCIINTIRPKVIYSDETTLRLDFGVNFAGDISVKAKGASGSKIVAKFAEMLDDDGKLYTANLRRAKCTDEFILSGEEDLFEPLFTYHGFRYAELKKEADVTIFDVQGLVISQNIDYYGGFECSDDTVNGIFAMAMNGQKCNFISIPTDCPQRDERLGWSGDAEVFCNSAMFNADCNKFFKNYLKMLRTDVLPDGRIPSIVPLYMAVSDNTAGVPGWGDCIAVMPYFHYLHYRDKTIIEDNLPAAEKWVGYYLAKSDDYLTRIVNNFGDWLSVDGNTDVDVINQCFFGYSALLVAKMCKIIGLDDKYEEYTKVYENCKDAFRKNYFENGIIKGNTQTAYAFAYTVGYINKEETRKRLIDLIRENGGGLTTGFIGSRFILPVLCDIGETELAYETMARTEYPSLGYMLKNGATTVWERWNGYTKENGFEDPEMNSFNHYSLGSSVEWLYSYVLGIKLSPYTEKVVISPAFCEKLTYAKGRTRVKGGNLQVYWEIKNSVAKLKVTADEGVNYEIDCSAYRVISCEKNGNETTAVIEIKNPKNEKSSGIGTVLQANKALH